MKQNKSSDAKGKIGPATPKRKLELRRATLRALTTAELLVPVGASGGTYQTCLASCLPASACNRTVCCVY
jgi:hypothetical protein